MRVVSLPFAMCNHPSDADATPMSLLAGILWTLGLLAVAIMAGAAGGWAVWLLTR